jgi:hypothetical protein
VRKLWLLGLLLCAMAPVAEACIDNDVTAVEGWLWVSVCSSTGCSGHFQWGVLYYVSTCEEGYGGGGGAGGSSTPAAVTSLQQKYIQNNCYVPDVAQFIDQATYNQSGMQQYFAFSDWTDQGSAYVLVDAPLPGMINSMASCMGGSLPALAESGTGAGYRVPGMHPNSDPCSSHAQGESVDLSTRDSSGNHPCQLWNQLAACAHNAGLYVEPWPIIKATGTIHMHVTTHFGPNDPSEYGDACVP